MTWRVALFDGFLRPDGGPPYPDFDAGPLEADPGIALTRLPPRPVILPEDTAGLDALVLLGEEFRVSSIAPDGRLSLVARFAVFITPGAVRAPWPPPSSP